MNSRHASGRSRRQLLDRSPSEPSSSPHLLDELIARQSKDVIRLDQFYAHLMLRRLKNLGINTSRADLTRFTKRFAKAGAGGRVILPLSERRVRLHGLEVKDVERSLQEKPTEEELAAYQSDLSKILDSAVKHVVRDTARAYTTMLATSSKAILNDRRRCAKEFRRALAVHWEEALNGFQVLIEIARDIGQSAIEQCGQKSPHKSRAAAHLFGRACQTAEEIRVLLSEGYADGAQARWRSLHELQVVIRILNEGDEELSRRYLFHHDIDLYHEAVSSLADGQRAGVVLHRQVARLRETRDVLLREFGSNFDAPYGWAFVLFNRKATFRDLEKRAGGSYLRPHYKSASANVHASSRGTLWRLGVPADFEGALAGPSPFGIPKPAVEAIHSLTLCVISLVSVSPSADVTAKVMAFSKFASTLDRTFRIAARRFLTAQRQVDA